MGELTFSDRMLESPAAAPGFDRFYFDLHGPAREPFVVLGAGVYPPAGIVDAYVLAAVDGVQRNLRVSDRLDSARPGAVGPLRWEVLEPMDAWRLRLEPNPSGIELDVTWRARAAAYATRYRVVDERGGSDHGHFFQSGRYDGALHVDGDTLDAGGWTGQRDRSHGHRRVRDRLGLHLWVQAQFPHESIGVLSNFDRAGSATHCDGAVMAEDGTVQPVVAMHHALAFAEDLELRSGRLELELADGSTRRLDVESTGRGLYMAGGGHGGGHGMDRGSDHVEHERWPLDGSRGPRDLPVSLTQALARFREGRAEGRGIFEYAVTRSPAFRYAPTLEP